MIHNTTAWNSGIIGSGLAVVISLILITKYFPQRQSHADAVHSEAAASASVDGVPVVPLAAKKPSKFPPTFRIRGIPISWTKSQLRAYLQEHCSMPKLLIKSFAQEIANNTYVATASCEGTIPKVLRLPTVDQDDRSQYLSFDTNFRGMTTLYEPPKQDHAINVIAVHGLGGHGFGAFKERGGEHMWLLDSLPYDLHHPETKRPMARIIIYGHESDVDNNEVMQNLEDIALAFREALLPLASMSTVKPIMLLGHSLGGLILKQALLSMIPSPGNDSSAYRSIMRAMRAIVFFAVPHDGMNINALRVVVGNQHNRFLIESLGNASSSVLKALRQSFDILLSKFSDIDIFCFYELVLSSSIAQNEGAKPTMTGPKIALVTKASAIHVRGPDRSDDSICGIVRSHSDIVKFGWGDDEYEKVRSRLRTMAQNIVTRKNLRCAIELHQAVLSNLATEVKKLLEAGGDVNARNADNTTLLLVAAGLGNLPMMELLLEEGADADASDMNDSVPLHEALKQRNTHMIRILFQRSADVTLRDTWGHSPFHLAVISSTEILELFLRRLPKANLAYILEARTSKHATSGGGETPLHLTSLRGEERPNDLEAFKEGARNASLLLEYGAHVDALTVRGGYTALHKAAKLGNATLAKVLLRFRADRTIMDELGCTAAQQDGVSDEVRTLISNWE